MHTQKTGPNNHRHPMLLALLMPLACAVAQAQTSIAPLVCERAKVTVFSGCPEGLVCGPGDGGPGMMQLLGSPGTTGATGGGLASGISPFPSPPRRTVWVDYAVPNVGMFLPAKAGSLFKPVITRTWIIKNSSVPGAIASSNRHTHGRNDVGVSNSVTTDDLQSPTNVNGWLLVGQVTGTVYAMGMMQYVEFGFSCRMPIQNLVWTYHP